MAIPTYEQMLRPVLALASAGDITRKIATAAMEEQFALSVEDREARIPSGQSTYAGNRAGWAMTFLTKGGLIAKVAPRTYRITDLGQSFLSQHPQEIRERDLAHLLPVRRPRSAASRRLLGYAPATCPTRSAPLLLQNPRTPPPSPEGWKALNTALVHAASLIAGGESQLHLVAVSAVRQVAEAGFRSQPDDRRTRFLGMKIMPFQDALYVMNELPDWRFPDEVLLVTWLVECGGPAMGRGPARAEYQKDTPDHYVGGTRALFNAGLHGNGPGWPESHQWPASACRHMTGARV